MFYATFLYPMLHVVYYVKPKKSGHIICDKLKLSFSNTQFRLPQLIFVLLVSMHESYYVISFNYFLFYRLGTGELRVMWGGGEGTYELPPSHGWHCLVENTIIAIIVEKPREGHSTFYDHHHKHHHFCHSIVETKYLFIYQRY